MAGEGIQCLGGTNQPLNSGSDGLSEHMVIRDSNIHHNRGTGLLSACNDSLIENNKFVAVGRRGELTLPPGATRVDLAVKTVIPALIDAHSHIGYMRDLTSGPQNYTRENILDQAEVQRLCRQRS